MLRLNDDCLIQIFQYLSVQEQLIAVDVCQRFQNIICFMWKILYGNYDTADYRTDTLTTAEYMKFFAYLAPQLKHLTINDINVINLPYRSIVSFYLKYSFPQIIELKSKELNLYDSDLRALIDNSPKLEILNLKSNRITGEYIEKSKNLQELYVPMAHIYSNRLCKILSELKLKRLDISGNEGEFANAVHRLRDQNNCFNILEDLTCTGYDLNKLISNNDFNMMSNLKHLHVIISTCCLHEVQLLWSTFFNLKGNAIIELKLSFFNINQIGNYFYEHANNLKNLEILHIYQYEDCTFNSSDYDMIKRFVENCKLLRHIQITCFVLSFDYFKILIEEIINCLEKQQRINTLTLHLKGDSDYDWNQSITRIKRSNRYQNQKVLKLEADRIGLNGSSRVFLDCKFNN